MICKLCGLDEVPNHKCSLLDDIKAHQEWKEKIDKKAGMANVGLTPYPHNMTKVQWRKMMAAMAMSGAGLVMGADRPMHDEVVEWAYARADAMLAEGDKNNE